ncbi:hypothetical protein [Streptomyces sp. NPDC002403]
MRQRTGARTEWERTYGGHDGRSDIRTSTGRTAALAAAAALLAGCVTGPDTGPGPGDGGKGTVSDPHRVHPAGDAAGRAAACTRDDGVSNFVTTWASTDLGKRRSADLPEGRCRHRQAPGARRPAGAPRAGRPSASASWAIPPHP